MKIMIKLLVLLIAITVSYDAISDSPPVTPFSDPLVAQIPIIRPARRDVRFDVTIAANLKSHKFHSEMLPSLTYGYGGMEYLGPTIETYSGLPTKITWKNNLPPVNPVSNWSDAILIPTSLQGESNRSIVHLHGGHTPIQFDGGPDHLVHAGKTLTVTYPNSQPATSLWYHDHAMGITRTNVYAGLAALYWVRDDIEKSFNLPTGIYEIPLVIQDKEFDPLDHSLLYPPKWEPEFFGDRNVVNGTIWPYLRVEARKYRFRIYNGASARFYNLVLSDTDGSSVSVLPFHQIGAEQGFLPRSVKLKHILLANAERADVIIDFSKLAGKTLYLNNDAATPFNPNESPLESDDISRRIMKIIVDHPKAEDTSHKVPMDLVAEPMLHPSSERIVLVHELEDFRFGTAPDGSSIYNQILINDRPFGYDGVHPLPVAHTVKKNTVQQWTYINTTPDTHPMHPHLVAFRIISRQKFDVEKFQHDYPNNSYPFPNTDLSEYYVGPEMRPAENELGPKDTVRINPGEITKIVAKFDLVGTYVHHCHILEHEENDAMEAFKVIP